MTPARRYYSQRTAHSGDLSLTLLKELFNAYFDDLFERGYFQHSLGYSCVDSGFVPGEAGTDIERALFLRLHRHGLWPVRDNIDGYSEHDLFDMIEVLHDWISQPGHGYYHDFSDCGWHYDGFNQRLGQLEWRTAVNSLLSRYRGGFELSEEGEILSLPPEGLVPLLELPLAGLADDGTRDRIDIAIRKYRRYDATNSDRRDAVRDLFDLLEYIRPVLSKLLLSKDEADLFNIANNFAIRHHNQKQRTEYDADVWLDWLFYLLVATLQAAYRLLGRGPSAATDLEVAAAQHEAVDLPP